MIELPALPLLRRAGVPLASLLAGLFALAPAPALWANSAYLLGAGTGADAFLMSADPTERPNPKHSDPSLFPQGYYDGDPMPANTVYLSFDDGPSDFTEAILDILKENNVPATFFINSFVRGVRGGDPHKNALMTHATTLRRMIMEGHVIGNHSFSHRNLGTQPVAVIDHELDLLDHHLKEALGADAPTLHLIRPPFGSPWIGGKYHDDQRQKVTTSVSQRGLMMLWGFDWDSTDSAEWVKGEWYTTASPLYKPGDPAFAKKVKRILDHLLSLAEGGRSGVILMHDVHPTTRDMLGPLIRELKARGYTFATLEDYARWRWGPHVFDRFHTNDPNARPQPPALPSIALAMLADRPFPPNQATAPRLIGNGHPNQATAPRISAGLPHPSRQALPDELDSLPGDQASSTHQDALPLWFPRGLLLPPSDSLMAILPVGSPNPAGL